MVFMFFFMLGIFSVAVIILLKASAPSRKNKFLILAFSDESDKECILKLRWLTVLSAVSGLDANTEIGVIDMGMSDATKREIMSVFGDKKQIIILNKADITEKILR